MSVEKISKLIPIHMRMVDKMLERKQRRLFNEDASPVDIEVENEVLWEITQFLRDKLHDIQIDTIRYGLNHEDDYEWKFGKPSKSRLFESGMKLYEEYLIIESRLSLGMVKSSVYSDSEDDVKELINKLIANGYPVYYKKNDMTKDQWVIRFKEEKKQ